MYRGKKQRMRSLLPKILIVVMAVVSVVQTDSVWRRPVRRLKESR